MIDHLWIESYFIQRKTMYDSARLFKAIVGDSVKTILYPQYGLVTLNGMVEQIVCCRA